MRQRGFEYMSARITTVRGRLRFVKSEAAVQRPRIHFTAVRRFDNFMNYVLLFIELYFQIILSEERFHKGSIYDKSFLKNFGHAYDLDILHCIDVRVA